MLLDEKLEYLYKKEPDTCLYHYTSMDGYLGILRSGTLWASEARYLNDTAEVSHFFARVISKINSNKSCCPEKKKLFHQFREWIEIRNYSSPGSSPNIFLTSFSQEGNTLSQWRGYCPTGGVSLGFQANNIIQIASKAGALLGKCMYKKEELEQVVETILNIVESGATECNKSDSTQSYHKFFASIELSLLKVAVLFKHNAYDQEEEWRLIIEPDNLHPSNDTKYRDSLGSLIPYKDICLKEKGSNGGLLIDKVIVGPSSRPENNFSAVSQAFCQYQSPNLQSQIINSKIPYRGR